MKNGDSRKGGGRGARVSRVKRAGVMAAALGWRDRGDQDPPPREDLMCHKGLWTWTALLSVRWFAKQQSPSELIFCPCCGA